MHLTSLYPRSADVPCTRYIYPIFDLGLSNYQLVAWLETVPCFTLTDQLLLVCLVDFDEHFLLTRHPTLFVDVWSMSWQEPETASPTTTSYRIFNYFYLRLSINISLIYVHNWRVGSLIYVHNWRAGSLIYVHNWRAGSLIYVHNWRVGSLIYVHNWRVGSLIYVHNWRVGTIRLNGEYHDMLLNKVQTIS